MSSTASSIHIRPAAKADVPAILRFIGELAEYEKLPHEMVATEALLHRHLFGLRPMAEVLIAEMEGREVGFSLFFHNFSTFLGKPGIYLEDIYVQPQARGKGVGTALLKEIAKLAVARDCGRLEWSVLDWNEPSIGFYLSLGAVAMSDWTMYRVTGEALKKLGQD